MAARVRDGEEAAITELVRRYHRSMTRVALNYVRDRGTAEGAVQESWMAVMRGISQFKGSGSLKNWIYAILVNLAKARGKRDARLVPFAFISDHQAESPDGSLEHALQRSRSSSDEFTAPWGADGGVRRSTEDGYIDRELLALIVREITELPVSQRAVIYLRDVRGLSAKDVCEELAISDGAQRVHLHRARNRVRAAIAPYLQDNGVWMAACGDAADPPVAEPRATSRA